METLATPIPDDTTTHQQPKKIKNTKNPLHKKRGNSIKKNLEQKNLFDDEAVEEWKNPCYSIEWSNENRTDQNYTTSYGNVRKSEKF